MGLKFYKQVLYLVLIINIIVCALWIKRNGFFSSYFSHVLHVQNAIPGVDFSLDSGTKFLLALMGLTHAH